jgi:hypothetical protein
LVRKKLRVVRVRMAMGRMQKREGRRERRAVAIPWPLSKAEKALAEKMAIQRRVVGAKMSHMPMRTIGLEVPLAALVKASPRAEMEPKGSLFCMDMSGPRQWRHMVAWKAFSPAQWGQMADQRLEAGGSSVSVGMRVW